VAVGGTPTANVVFIGDDKIRVASTNIYKLENATDVEFIIEDPKKLVKLQSANNTCTIVANENNKLGTFVLKAIYNGQIYSKTVQVVSLW
jgi:hypothetical protein